VSRNSLAGHPHVFGRLPYEFSTMKNQMFDAFVYQFCAGSHFGEGHRFRPRGRRPS